MSAASATRDSDDDDFIVLPAQEKRKEKKKKRMQLLKNGVSKFLNPKKRREAKKLAEADQRETPLMLMEPQEAQTSILRVILLVAQTQLNN